MWVVMSPVVAAVVSVADLVLDEVEVSAATEPVVELELLFVEDAPVELSVLEVVELEGEVVLPEAASEPLVLLLPLNEPEALVEEELGVLLLD